MRLETLSVVSKSSCFEALPDPVIASEILLSAYKLLIINYIGIL
jgi:hypothetical protein